MKKLFLIITIILSVAFTACGEGGTDTENPGSDPTSGSGGDGSNDVTTTEEELCEEAAGEWTEFSSTCATKTCANLEDDGECIGLTVITESCDCGDGFCWDGESCIEL